MNPIKLFNINNKLWIFIPSSHFLPVQKAGHRQTNPSLESTLHVAPLWQGSESHFTAAVIRLTNINRKRLEEASTQLSVLHSNIIFLSTKSRGSNELLDAKGGMTCLNPSRHQNISLGYVILLNHLPTTSSGVDIDSLVSTTSFEGSSAINKPISMRFVRTSLRNIFYGESCPPLI